MSGGLSAPPLPADWAPPPNTRVRIFPPFVCSPQQGQNVHQHTLSHVRLFCVSDSLKCHPLFCSGAVAKDEVTAWLSDARARECWNGQWCHGWTGEVLLMPDTSDWVCFTWLKMRMQNSELFLFSFRLDISVCLYSDVEAESNLPKHENSVVIYSSSCCYCQGNWGFLRVWWMSLSLWASVVVWRRAVWEICLHWSCVFEMTRLSNNKTFISELNVYLKRTSTNGHLQCEKEKHLY